MKAAKRTDYYRRAFENLGIFQIVQVHCANAPSLGKVQLNLGGRIAVLCGANGAGKTTLLQLLSNLFTSVDGQGVRMGGAKLEGSSATVTYLISGEERTIGCSFNAGKFASCAGERDPDLSVIYLDAAARVKEIGKLISEQGNFEEIIEGLEANELNAKQLAAYNFVLNRDYTSIKVYEVDVFEDLGTFPYFDVEVDGISYNSATAGLGELAIMHTLWELMRLPGQSPTLLLLEEPETNVSARSQSALIDTIVQYSTIRKLFVIISTHSPNIVSQIPNANIKFLVRSLGALQVVDNPSDLRLESTLGKTPRFRGIALIEDEVARMYVHELFRRVDSELLRIFDLVIAGDESKITSALKTFPRLNWLKIDGIYDGDMSGTEHIENAIKETMHTGRFIPSKESIEGLFRSLSSKYLDVFADRLKSTVEEFTILLSEIAGLDHHDWFKQLSVLTSISESHLISILVDFQLEDEQMGENIRNFVNSIREAATA